jgi:hypothetical protein
VTPGQRPDAPNNQPKPDSDQATGPLNSAYDKIDGTLIDHSRPEPTSSDVRAESEQSETVQRDVRDTADDVTPAEVSAEDEQGLSGTFGRYRISQEIGRRTVCRDRTRTAASPTATTAEFHIQTLTTQDRTTFAGTNLDDRGHYRRLSVIGNRIRAGFR